MEHFDIDGNILLKCQEKDILIADIPDCVTEIAENAFSGCKKLTKVNLNNITTIRDFAFSNCTALQSVDLSNIKILGMGAFYGCSSLKSVQFGEKLGYLSNHAFDGSGLERLVLPESLWYIGQSCFHDCVELVSIEMLGVMEIDRAAFEGCWKLYSVQFPASLLHIAPYAFSFCGELQTVTIKNTFMEIDETAFDNIVNLLIKAVQFSTASRHAKDAHIRFAPIIVDECIDKCSDKFIPALKKSGLFFQAKPINEDEIFIRYDKSQAAVIQKIIGKSRE